MLHVVKLGYTGYRQRTARTKEFPVVLFPLGSEKFPHIVKNRLKMVHFI